MAKIPSPKEDFGSRGAFEKRAPSLDSEGGFPRRGPPSHDDGPDYSRVEEGEVPFAETPDTRDAESAGPDNSLTLNVTSFSDAPATQDRLGFEPYVRALAWFLIDERTTPPLTVSVEGPWGSGKSSFMQQLARRLLAVAKDREQADTIRAIWFNPWKNDKDEALWASFALTLLKQLERRTPWRHRLNAKAKLTWARIDWLKALPALFRLAAYLAIVVALFAAVGSFQFLIQAFPLEAISAIRWLTKGIAGVAALFGVFKFVTHMVGNPLPKSLADYIRNPKHDERVSLIERFTREFADILNAYVGKSGRVFVFIDDLDRCEVPRAAELMQAINLLMASDLQLDLDSDAAASKTPSLIFVLGIDREMVAVGIAAKNATILPYLAARKDQAEGRVAGPMTPATDPLRYGVEYGFRFLEKFIQTPFHVPRVRDDELKAWIKDLVGVTAQASKSARPFGVTVPPSIDRGSLLAGQDPDQFDDIVANLAGRFGFSPRQVKQFVNLFRLQIAIAVQTGQLVEAPASSHGGLPSGLTLERLGLVCAIFQSRPTVVGKIFEDPNHLWNLESTDAELKVYMEDLGPAYSLVGINLQCLVEVMPDAYPEASLGNGGKGSRLGPGGPQNPDSSPTANNAPSPAGLPSA